MGKHPVARTERLGVLDQRDPLARQPWCSGGAWSLRMSSYYEPAIRQVLLTSDEEIHLTACLYYRQADPDDDLAVSIALLAALKQCGAYLGYGVDDGIIQRVVP